MSKKIHSIQAEADKAGLKTNSKKTKGLWTHSKTTNINVNNVVIERVEQSLYLGSVVTVDGRALQDVKMCIKKENGIFVEIYPLWKNKNVLLMTKIYTLNSNVKLVLLYGCETWKVTTQLTNKFHLLISVCEG
jgi:hypothetical protein